MPGNMNGPQPTLSWFYLLFLGHVVIVFFGEELGGVVLGEVNVFLLVCCAAVCCDVLWCIVILIVVSSVVVCCDVSWCGLFIVAQNCNGVWRVICCGVAAGVLCCVLDGMCAML